MYDSDTLAAVSAFESGGQGSASGRIQAPLVSIFEKQLSIILLFSSSYFSARPLPLVGAAEAERGALPSWLCPRS